MKEGKGEKHEEDEGEGGQEKGIANKGHQGS